MKLVPYKIEKIKTKRPYGNNQAIIEEFIKMDVSCVRVENFTQSNANGCCAALNNSAKRMGKHNVRAVSRRGEVFMIRTDLVESV